MYLNFLIQFQFQTIIFLSAPTLRILLSSKVVKARTEPLCPSNVCTQTFKLMSQNFKVPSLLELKTMPSE